MSKSVATLIDRYIREFRVHHRHADSVWLFPARDTADRPRARAGLASAISQAILRHVGIEMHVHLFRAYAAKVLLNECPGAVDDLRQLLGHKGLETTLAYYTHFRVKQVGQEHLDRMTSRQAAATRLIPPAPKRGSRA